MRACVFYLFELVYICLYVIMLKSKEDNPVLIQEPTLIRVRADVRSSKRTV